MNIINPKIRLSVWDAVEDNVNNKPKSQQVDKQPSSTKNASTPRHVKVNMNDIANASKKNPRKGGLCIKCCLAFLILLLIIAAGVVPAVVIIILKSDITTTTMATTTIACVSGLTATSSGACVNTQIDFNNCGSVAYACSSNYTSCSGGLCSTTPAVMLSGAIGVPGFNSSISSIDDAITTVTLPLNITLYNYTTNNITVSSNGVICLGICSTDYSNGNLSSSSFGGPTVFGFWDDLFITTGTSQAIYYAISGTAPNRITTFEFYESSYASSTQYYHFQVIFYENLPNIVKCFYFDMSDGGASATIGIQASASGPSVTYSEDQANAVIYNTSLIFNTNTGTFTG
ncbi:unnamed protein product [Adineta steineri]|uniref:Uncharacterized protein n=1 Tax=Adineta steineri TaxID=433720 RepID=A0A818QQU3_9BILA|nr:unnamed protein product [Adineta steineri]CAF1310916.1 unnamed protein product [Adineta steineri]CAF3638238.1 unnamed protein product [Adineta steineri]CAF3706318.1 unnamed protein product [Adineta steineri]